MIGGLLGWIGAIAYACCAFPQAVRCWRNGHGEGLSATMLWVWLVGGVSMLIAIPLKFGWVPWLMMNYAGNISALLIIMRYHFWPSRR